MSSRRDDSELVRDSLSGDHEAFVPLVRRYKALVFTVIYRILGDREEAEDLAQEAFVRAHAALSTLREAHRFKSWLMRIASHEALKSLRKRGEASLRLDDEGGEQALLARAGERLREMDPARRSQRWADLTRVTAALKRLQAPYRQALVLRYFAHLSYKEIAEVAAASLATVKFRIHHGMKLLRAHCVED